ncbi:MAG TPA: hypothetical protein VFL14_05755, partial [Xanthomonadales bacterium]|nr:hypothetical protein [Xanthomonadales bacterium]
LAPGAVVGPASTFLPTGVNNAVNLRAGGVFYFGVRLPNETGATQHYAWVQLTTTGPNGVPATITRFAWDNTPNTAITVPGGTNTPPQFTYNPAASGTVNFTGGTTVGSTGNGSIAVTVGTPGTGTGPTATTTTTCTAPTGAFAGFAQSVSAIGSGAITGSPLTGTCTLGAAVQTQTLTCSENRGGTAVPVTFTLSCPAGTPVNTPPQFTYNPAAGGAVNFTGGGAAGSTGNATIAVTVGTPGAGTGAAATTTTTCTAPTAPFAGFAQTVSAVGNGAVTGSPFTGTCTLGAAQATQTLTCSENRGGTPTPVTFTLTCPAGTVAAVTSNPASGTTIAFGNITPGGTATRTVTFTNTAAVAQTVTCTATAAPFTTAPLSIPVPAGGSASTTITFTSATVGNYTGNLSCTAGAAAFTFPITGGVAPAATSVPTFGNAARWLAMLMLLGVGLAALATRRRA